MVTTAARFLGLSPQAYPVHIPISITPFLSSSFSILPYNDFPGSTLVLVFSPGRRIGISDQALYFGFPLPL